MTAGLPKVCFFRKPSAKSRGLLPFRQREKGKLLQVPILPELAALTGVRQNLNYHAYDVWQHTLKTLSLSEGSLEIRWALLLHDIGKGRPQVRSCDEEGNPTDHGHERLSAEMAQNILQRLRFPPKFVKRVVWLIANHMQLGFHMDKEDFVSERWVRRTALSGSFRWNSEMCEAFLQLSAVCLADLGATKAHEQEIIAMRMYIDKLLQAVRLMPVHTSDLAVSGRQVEEILHNKEVLPSLMRPSASTNSTSSKPSRIAARRCWNSGKVPTCLICGVSRRKHAVRTRRGRGSIATGAPTATSTSSATCRPRRVATGRRGSPWSPSSRGTW